jgi:hypothetical protein
MINNAYLLSADQGIVGKLPTFINLILKIFFKFQKNDCQQIANSHVSLNYNKAFAYHFL